MYAPGYTQPPGGMTDTGERVPSMSADQIRAEIARLQKMLAQIEGSSDSQAPNYIDPAYQRWLNSMSENFKKLGKWDYYEFKDGQLVFNPELAKEKEYWGWASRQESERKRQETLQEQARLKAIEEEKKKVEEAKKQQLKSQIEYVKRNVQMELDKKKQNPDYVITPNIERLAKFHGMWPSETQTIQTNMPPAWS